MPANPARSWAGLVGDTALHQLHSAEVAARVVGCAAGMHDGQLLALPDGEHWPQTRMKTEKTIQVKRAQRRRGAAVIGMRNGKGGTAAIIEGLAVRNNDIQRIRRTTQ